PPVSGAPRWWSHYGLLTGCESRCHKPQSGCRTFGPRGPKGETSEHVELLVPVERNAATKSGHQTTTQPATAIEQFARQPWSQEGQRQHLLDVSRGDAGFRRDLLSGACLTFLQPTAPFVGSGQSPQHDGVGLTSAVVEHCSPIAIGKSCLHDDGPV